jgi:hypothetical protein
MKNEYNTFIHIAIPYQSSILNTSRHTFLEAQAFGVDIPAALLAIRSDTSFSRFHSTLEGVSVSCNLENTEARKIDWK